MRRSYSLWLGWFMCVLIQGQVFSQGRAGYSRISVTTFMDIINTHEDVQNSSEQLILAQSEIEIAKTVPSPTLVLGNASGDVSGINMPHQLYAGVEYSIEGGGKRKNRMRYANAQLELAAIKRELFVRTFKRDAWLLFHRCWIEEQQIATQQYCLNQIHAIHVKDSVSAFQRRIALQRLQVELSQSTEKHAGSLEKLNLLVGPSASATIVAPLMAVPYDPNLDSVTVQLDEDNIHILERKATADLLNREVDLMKSNRKGDYSITLANSFITRGTNPEAPSPRYNAITAMISIPLRFSPRAAEQRRDKFVIEEAEQEEQEIILELREHYVFIQQQKKKIAADLNKIASLINDQQNLITMMGPAATAGAMLVEIDRLYEFHTLQWKSSDALADVTAEQFWYTGKLPVSRHIPVTVSK